MWCDICTKVVDSRGIHIPNPNQSEPGKSRDICIRCLYDFWTYAIEKTKDFQKVREWREEKDKEIEEEDAKTIVDKIRDLVK